MKKLRKLCKIFSSTASRLSNFYIDASYNSEGVSSRQCVHELIAFSESETRVYGCPPETRGRYVIIRFDESKSEYLQLCEVQVQGERKLIKVVVL